MANQAQQEKKSSILNPGEWILFVSNWVKRLPGIRRYRIGRVRIGERKHPIEKELRALWLTLNDSMFSGPLETIETMWDKQSGLLGADSKANFLGNSNGIVALYKKLGAYADKYRVENERCWFQFGTGSEEHEVTYQFPEETEWNKYQWDSSKARRIKANTSEPWKIFKIKKYKINPGIVYHEGKLKEEIYTLGYLRTQRLGEELRKYLEIVLEDLRRRRLPVEVRTKMGHVATEFEKLFQEIAKIEQETYSELSKLTPDIKPDEGRWDKMWDELVNDYTPEKKGIVIRFAHTYRVIRTFVNERFEEKIKKVNDEGEVYEDKIRYTDENGNPVERPYVTFKTIYFDPASNTWENELRTINGEIQHRGGEASIVREANQSKADADWYTVQMRDLNTQIKPLFSTGLTNDFKPKLINNFSNALYEKERMQFVAELAEKIATILQLLRRLEIDELFKFIDQILSTYGISSRTTINLLKKIQTNLKKFYPKNEKVRLLEEVKKQFGSVLQELRRNNQITQTQFDNLSRVFNEKIDWLKKSIVEEEIGPSVSSRRYVNEIDGLFNFIYQKFSEFKIKLSRGEKGNFDNFKEMLLEEPYSYDKGRDTLHKLYDKIYKSNAKSRNVIEGREPLVRQGMIIEHLEQLKVDLSNELRSFSRQLDEALSVLVASIGQSYEIHLMKTNELFDLITLTFLKQIGIDREEEINKIKDQIDLEERQISIPQAIQLKRFIVKTREDFDAILNSGELSILIRTKETARLEKIRLIERRKELLGLIFKKEQLENCIHHLTPRNPRFHQRPEEKGHGLDENGYPLEIDPNTGEVLIDKWWRELTRNEWQLKTIAAKAGGRDVLERHLGLTVTFTQPVGKTPTHNQITINGTPNRSQRYVDDKRFYGYVDLLDAACMIFGTWDSVRDDLRDGRYHPHSKSVGDYVIEGEGGFDDKLGAPYQKRWMTYGPINKGMHLKRRGIFPAKNAAINVKVENPEVYIMAQPSDFENPKHPVTGKILNYSIVPEDEDTIKRDFKFRIPDSVTNSPNRDDIISTPNGNFLIGTRTPTKYNPAFDRRAANFKYMHWGCMYYYRWPGYPNEWSENPFPHVSTRGIALYISYLVGSDVWYYKEGEESLKGHKFDYGVRGMMKFGYNNPLSGDYVLQEN